MSRSAVFRELPWPGKAVPVSGMVDLYQGQNFGGPRISRPGFRPYVCGVRLGARWDASFHCGAAIPHDWSVWWSDGRSARWRHGRARTSGVEPVQAVVRLTWGGPEHDQAAAEASEFRAFPELGLVVIWPGNSSSRWAVRVALFCRLRPSPWLCAATVVLLFQAGGRLTLLFVADAGSNAWPADWKIGDTAD